MKAAEKRKPIWGDALTALIILAAAGLLLFALFPSDGTDRIAVATADGETVWTCPLEKVTDPVRYTVEGKFPLTLEVTYEGIRVVSATCPGEDCRHTGLISQVGQQIVCLPNRTVITLQGDGSGCDAVTG